MCGRFTLKTPIEQVWERLGAEGSATAGAGVRARYNIAPSQEILAVREGEEGREISFLTWGLIPSWSREPKGFINARAETLAEKPSSRESFQRRRCLIPADGFYEWKREGRGKRPYYFRLKGGEPFAFAGIWDEWGRGDNMVTTCAVITTRPNELLSEVHDRMPVILAPEDYGLWLDPGVRGPEQVRALLRPYAAGEMASHPVSSQVNSVSNDGPDCIEPKTE
jgi:putative SOS response-associated peptidase YedK